MDPSIRSVELDDASIPWIPTRHPGVRWYRLESHGASEDAVVVIRMAPGCGYPPHRHVGAEDVVVLRGGFRDEMGEHVAGTFLSYPPGSRHSPVACGDRERAESAENPPCILFSIAHGGVENL